MHITKHAEKRMNHRGINKDLLNIILNFGEYEGDTIILRNKKLNGLIAEIENIKHKLLKARDHGELILVIGNNKIITTYKKYK